MDDDPRETDRTAERAETRRPTVPSGATREAERGEATTSAGADRAPTPDEEAAAPTEVTDEQRAQAEEMLERGANQQGEGRIP